jgi:hypothetical protein
MSLLFGHSCLGLWRRQPASFAEGDGPSGLLALKKTGTVDCIRHIPMDGPAPALFFGKAWVRWAKPDRSTTEARGSGTGTSATTPARIFGEKTRGRLLFRWALQPLAKRVVASRASRQPSKHPCLWEPFRSPKGHRRARSFVLGFKGSSGVQKLGSRKKAARAQHVWILPLGKPEPFGIAFARNGQSLKALLP